MSVARRVIYAWPASLAAAFAVLALTVAVGWAGDAAAQERTAPDPPDIDPADTDPADTDPADTVSPEPPATTDGTPPAAADASRADDAEPSEQASGPEAVGQELIVVCGAAGAPRYGTQIAAWADRLEAAAAAGGVDVIRIGGAAGEDPAEESTGAEEPADRELLRQALSERGARQTTEPLWLVLLGHGSFDTRTANFNLRGPDVSAAELSDMCQAASRPLAVIACFSCSAPFLNALSGDNRVVVTATRDGSQLQWSRFGDAFTQAFVSPDSDIDRDGQTSLLEAWLYGARRTAESYAGEGRLATEHSLLDDNGDERGTRAELYDGYRPAANVDDPQAIDGGLARRWHLVRSEAERRLTTEQRAERDRLETELEELRLRKDAFADEDAWLNAIEPILLRLARIYAAAETSSESLPPDTGDERADPNDESQPDAGADPMPDPTSSSPDSPDSPPASDGPAGDERAGGDGAGGEPEADDP